MKLSKATVIYLLIAFLFLTPSLFAENSASDSKQTKWLAMTEQVGVLLESEQLEEAVNTAYQALEFAEKNFGDQDPRTAQSIFNIAEIFMEIGDLDQAEPLYSLALQIIQTAFGEESPERVNILDRLGNLHFEQGEYEQAKKDLTEVLTIRQKLLGPTAQETISTTTTMASLYMALGDYDKSETLLKQVVAGYKELGDESSQEMIEAQENLAVVHGAKGDYKEAESLFQKVLELKKAAFGVDNTETLYTMSSLGELYRRMGHYSKASPLLTTAIEKYRENLTEENAPDLYLAIGYQAKLHENRGDYPKAEELYQQVLEYHQSVFGEKHPDTIIDLNQLSGVYQKQGKYEEAEQGYKQALDGMVSMVGKRHPESITIMNNLGQLYETLGLFEKSEPLFKEVVQSGREVLGVENPKTIIFMNNLASLYESQGVFEKSEPLYRQVIELNRKRLGKEHPDTVAGINNLGYLYLMQEKHGKAGKLFKQVYQQWKKQLGERHQKTLKSQNNLARVYHQQGKLKESETLFQQALQLRKEVLGNKHRDAIRSRIDLGALYLTLKKYPEAYSILSEAVSTAEESLGKHHPYTFEALNGLADYYEKANKPNDALETREIIFNRRTEFLNRILWAAGENTRQSYIKLYQNELDRFFQLLVTINSPKTAELALHASLQRKGILLKIASEIQKVVELSNSPKLSALANDLKVKRKLLASMTLSGPKEEKPEEFQQILVNLEEEVNNIQAQLGAASKAFSNTSQTIKTEQLFEKIEDEAVLVDYLTYRDNGVTKLFAIVAQNKMKECYIWWECKKPEIVMVPLGDLEETRKEISYFREAIQSEDAEEEELLKSGLMTYNKVWNPLKEHFGEKTSIYIVPESALHLLPFDALINEEEEYLIRTMDLKILSSGRDLVVSPLPRAKGDFTIFAGPDFDSDYLKSQRQKLKSERTRSVGRSMRVASNGLRSLSFDPLEGAEIEGKTIKEVSDLKRSASTIYSQKAAEEQQIRGLGKAPQMLHIATHGFFLAEEESLVKRLLSVQRGGSHQIPPPGDNPLLRAGLAFAGINANAPFLGDMDTDNDGVLTAMEVLGLNLAGTKLVVLSACETGVGEIHDGEGVYGLRRAFQEAGVENVVNSLWPVSDEGTRSLMTEFYQRIFEGVPTRQALKEAQLKLIDSEEWNHPYYWGAFLMVTKRDGQIQ